MQIVLYTMRSIYKGELPENHTARSVVRLQDMVNTPSMPPSLSGGVSSMQIPMRPAVMYLEGSHGQVITVDFPEIEIDPSHVEMLFETAPKRLSGETGEAGRVHYERKITQRQTQRVEIVTTTQKRVAGELAGGMQALTHPVEDKRFFALTNVELNVLRPQAMNESLPFVLLNREFVESFRRLD